MTRRFNYTGRGRVTSDHFTARVASEDPLVASLSINLAELKLDPNAKIIVEPYAGTVSKRVECGTVGAPLVPDGVQLSELRSGGAIHFRIKVIDAAGRLLASADRIQLIGQNDNSNRRSLLPVETTPELGEEVWRIQVSASHPPKLQLNSRVPSIERRLVEDPVLSASVVIPAVRKVLQVLAENPGGEDWQEDWIQFARRWRPETSADSFPEDDEEREEWIDTVVEGFAKELSLVRKLTEMLAGKPT